MNTLSLDPVISAALSVTLKATALLAIAALVQAALHRRVSAASRHLVWLLAVVALLALPMLSLALPEWTVVSRTVILPPAHAELASTDVEALAPTVQRPLATPTAVATTGAAPASWTALPWQTVVAGTYMLGIAVLFSCFVAERWRLHSLAQRATVLADDGWGVLLQQGRSAMDIRRRVRLLRTRECGMPMAVGICRPAVLIPAIADTWSDDRRRAVVLHELAHVARRDCLAQVLALAVCTIYWFHPGVWWVARRLRIERELACDDRVIAAGAPARDYAGHLLEIAFSFGNERTPAPAVAMARPRQLEGRMLAALDATRNRRIPAFRAYAIGTLMAAAVVLPLAGATSKVVAVESRQEPAASAPANLHDVVPATLHALQWPLIDSARRFIYDVASAIGLSQDKLPGTWAIRPTNTDGALHLEMKEFNSSFGTTIRIEQLEGLTAAELSAGGPVQFRLRRDAGTFSFEGVIRSGVGAGTFSFAPAANFPNELAKRGFERPTPLEQYQLARNDTGYAFIDELNKQQYARPQTSELVRAGDHGVSLTYLREMSALGYRLGTLDPLIKLRDHGVTPGYIRELSDQGYKGLTADQLRNARDHGVTPDYVQALRDNGHGSLTMEKLINARDHGVDPDYARRMRQLGYTVSIDELIAARDHGVDADYTQEMASLGYSGLPLETLRRLRDHGVDPKYVQELKELGYERLPVDDLITLRDHGLTADRIRAANARAKSRLPVDLLKQLAR